MGCLFVFLLLGVFVSAVLGWFWAFLVFGIFIISAIAYVLDRDGYL